MASQLYAVSAMDPLVLGSVGAVLAVVALVACTLPARIDPVIALNQN